MILAVLTTAPTVSEARIDTLYCEPRAKMRAILEIEYGAEMTGQGLRGPDVVLEIWSSPRNGDWTLVQSYANGQACVVAMGEGWESLSPQARDAG